MTDVFSKEQRSAVMRAVRSRDTAPEIHVRKRAHALGYRFRLQRAELPGRPDLVFPARRIALFVHGCFWHGHDCARGARVPLANRDYWIAKIGRNRNRQEDVRHALEAIGWRCAELWECEVRPQNELDARLIALLGPAGSGTA